MQKLCYQHLGFYYMIKHMSVLKYLGSGSVQTEKASHNIFCQNSDLLLKYYFK